MLAAGALKAVDIMDNNPDIFGQLQRKCELMQDTFDHMEGLELLGDRISPVKHLRLIEADRMPRSEQKLILRRIIQMVFFLNILIV
jgi:hypothetical protein